MKKNRHNTLTKRKPRTRGRLSKKTFSSDADKKSSSRSSRLQTEPDLLYAKQARSKELIKKLSKSIERENEHFGARAANHKKIANALIELGSNEDTPLSEMCVEFGTKLLDLALMEETRLKENAVHPSALHKFIETELDEGTALKSAFDKVRNKYESNPIIQSKNKQEPKWSKAEDKKRAEDLEKEYDAALLNATNSLHAIDLKKQYDLRQCIYQYAESQMDHYKRASELLSSLIPAVEEAKKDSNERRQQATDNLEVHLAENPILASPRAQAASSHAYEEGDAPIVSPREQAVRSKALPVPSPRSTSSASTVGVASRPPRPSMGFSASPTPTPTVLSSQPTLTKLFGHPIGYYLEIQRTRGVAETSLPLVVTAATTLISAKGVSCEGLFRRSPSHARLKETIGRIEQGDDPYSVISESEVHVACALLKQFIRELKGGLIPDGDALDRFMASLSIDAEVELEYFQMLACSKNTLEQPNRVLLKHLLLFLHRLLSHQDETKMGSQNLALVFGPNFTDRGDVSMGVSSIVGVAKKMIECAPDIYEAWEEEIYEDYCATVQYDFEAQEEGEVPLTAGGKVWVWGAWDAEWVFVYHEGRAGLCPKNFLAPIASV